MTVKQDKSQVTLSQEHYVNTRLQTVDITKGALLEDQADEVAKMDNWGTILAGITDQARHPGGRLNGSEKTEVSNL